MSGKVLTLKNQNKIILLPAPITPKPLPKEVVDSDSNYGTFFPREGFQEVILDDEKEPTPTESQLFQKVEPKPPQIVRQRKFNNSNLNKNNLKYKTEIMRFGPREIEIEIEGLITKSIRVKLLSLMSLTSSLTLTLTSLIDKLNSNSFSNFFPNSIYRDLILMTGPLIFGILFTVIGYLKNCASNDNKDFSSDLQRRLNLDMFKKELSCFNYSQLFNICAILSKNIVRLENVSELAFGLQVSSLPVLILLKVLFTYLYQNYKDNEEVQRLAMDMCEVFKAKKVKVL